MKLTDKIRRDWHYYAVALGLIFILNDPGDQTDGVGLPPLCFKPQQPAQSGG